MKKMLQVALDHLEQVAISIQTLLDMNGLMVEEVTRRLRNVEQRKKNAALAIDKQGRLLLLEKEWLARLKLRDNFGKSGGSSGSKGDKKQWKSCGRAREKEGEHKKESADGRPIRCSNFGKKGHLSKDC